MTSVMRLPQRDALAGQRAARARVGLRARSVERIGRDAAPMRVQHVLDHRGDRGEADAAARGSLHRDLVGGVQHRGRGAARAQRRVREPQAGKARVVGRSNVRLADAREIERLRRRSRCAPDRRARRRSACACRDCRAARSPSRRRTRPANGRRSADGSRTSMRSARRVEQPVRLDHLQALVHHGGRVDRDLAPHDPVRMRAGLLGRHRVELLAAAWCETARPRRSAGCGARRRRRSPSKLAASTGRSRCARCRSAAASRPTRAPRA